MIIEYNNLVKRIKEKQYAPLILLDGEETFYVDRITRIIQDTFFEDESEKDFDFQLFYGKESNVNQIVASSKQFPMMASLRLVIVREAQALEKIAELSSYAKNPQPKTVLVLSFMEGKKMDGKLSVYKEFVKNGLVFHSAKIYDNKLPEHVAIIAKEKNFVIKDKEINLLISHTGNDLSRINNELDKLLNILPKGGTIDNNVIEKHIGFSREYNAFELASAILAHNAEKAYSITDYFVNNQGKYTKIVTFSAIFNAFYRLLQLHYSPDKSKEFMKRIGVFWTDYSIYERAISLYPLSKVKKIIHLTRHYDMLSKGANGWQGEEVELVRELTWKILNM